MKEPQLWVRDMLWLALKDQADDDRWRFVKPPPYSVEAVAVIAHAHYPAEFCMEGYRHYPDLHKVVAILSGRKGLVEEGCVVRVKGPDGRAAYRVGREPRGVRVHREIS